MIKRGKKTAVLLCLAAVCLALALTACRQSEAEAAPREAEEHIIGVVVFSQTDPELSMFVDYYRNYIAESFPVQFLISNDLSSTEEEIAFIRQAKEAGAEGIISFYGLGLAETVAACEEEEIYYVLGSASISDTDFDAVKDNPWFLGVIGPASSEEFRAGSDMAADFVQMGARSFLIVSGGAAGVGNFMHYSRVEGMLTGLQEELGLTFSQGIDELAASESLTVVETGDPDVTIVISPWYLQLDAGVENLRQAFADGDYDALLSTAGVTSVIDEIAAESAATGRSLLVGAVDCFSEANYDAVEQQDVEGHPMLNYVKGKYASMVAPAFVAVFNAAEGDLDVVNPGGEAFRLYQSYWTAAGEEEYVELYGYTQSIFENAYSSIDLMQVIKAYNADASFAQFQALTEACDIDSVRARLGE